jgi:hypothetical protein
MTGMALAQTSAVTSGTSILHTRSSRPWVTVTVVAPRSTVEESGIIGVRLATLASAAALQQLLAAGCRQAAANRR